MASASNYILTAAIDFGTTYSGYAIQVTSEYDPENPTANIFSPQTWNGGSTQLTSMKTPTCLLLDRNQDIDSFGFVAEEKYAELSIEGDHKEWYFFRRFKMQLHDTTGLTEATEIQDETNNKLPALTVFSKSIECLKIHLFELLKKKSLQVLPHEIKWVLTVPAIWDDAAKGFMRKAANQAGIPSQHLTIALEPESASLFCQYLPVERFSVGGEVKFSDAKPGTTYMIVDNGGGTTDITVHEKIANGKLKEVHRASGGPWGGTAVDGAFINLISGIIGGPVMAAFMKKNTYEYLELMREFESVKRNVSLKTTYVVKIKIPVALSETCVDLVKKDFKTLVKLAKKDKQITFIGDKVRFDPELIKGLFKKATDKIVSHMKDILDNNPAGRKVSLILMVGGFSESAFVQDVVKDAFHEKKGRTVLIPKDAGISVVQGAVIYGRRPDTIASRVLRFTYGAHLNATFQESVHEPRRKTTIAGLDYCVDVFGKFIGVGTEVTVGHKVCETYTTSGPFDKNCDLDIYITEDNTAKYIDDKGCRKLGSLVVQIPNPTKELRDVAVVYEFGDTELHIKATDKMSDKPCEATLKMLE